MVCWRNPAAHALRLLLQIMMPNHFLNNKANKFLGKLLIKASGSREVIQPGHLLRLTLRIRTGQIVFGLDPADILCVREAFGQRVDQDGIQPIN